MVNPALSVAIIGAGIAGAAAAHYPAAVGLDVFVIDKGRGVGGRMATRRLGEGLGFDHGAQYFTARDPRLIAQVETWVAAGVAVPWDAGPGWFVGTPAMTAPARALTQGLARHCHVNWSAVTKARLVGPVRPLQSQSATLASPRS